MRKPSIAIVQKDVFSYPDKKHTFRPSNSYPEIKAINSELDRRESNHVYDMVREGLYLMGLDKENYGTERWNPIGDNIVKPGDTVLIKPNLVMDNNPNGGDVECLYTNPSIIAAVIDYVVIALNKSGTVIVGDAPMQECDFEKLIVDSGYSDLIKYCRDTYSNIQFYLKDFRDLKTRIKHGTYEQSISNTTQGITVKLDSESEFWGMNERMFNRLRITNYDAEIMGQHHNTNSCEYYINKDVLNADVIINVPKPKTHRKAGVTIALKNMVGINSRKEYLPHHTMGSNDEGGDEYKNKNLFKSLKSRILDKRNRMYHNNNLGVAKALNIILSLVSIISRPFENDHYYEGSWYGNDTISKTIVDLNKILFYCDKNGNMQETKQRKYFIVADMIVSGEGEGPVQPSRKDVGIIAIGNNPVAFDKIIATIMGADTERIPTLMHAISPKGKYVLAGGGYDVVSNNPRWDGFECDNCREDAILHFKPTSGWKPVFNRN